MILYQEFNSVRHYNYNANIWHNFNYVPHFHSNYELIYVISGNLEIIVDEQSDNFEAGDWALILPNEIHNFITPEESCIWIGVFSDDFVTHFSSQMKEKRGESFKFRCDGPTEVYLKAKLITEEVSAVTLLKSCLYAACDQYLKNIKIISGKRSDNSLVYRILNYIMEHYTEDVTMKELAEDLGYEYHYLSRCFHKIFHMNFRQIINQYRFEHAKELMQKEDLPMTEIAFKSGFQSVRSFNSAFKEMAGIQPRQFAPK